MLVDGMKVNDDVDHRLDEAHVVHARWRIQRNTTCIPSRLVRPSSSL